MKVAGKNMVPGNCRDFLLQRTKTFYFSSPKIFFGGKKVDVTFGVILFTKGSSHDMLPCDNEDIRLLVRNC